MVPGYSIPVATPRGSLLRRLAGTLAIGAGCFALSADQRRRRLTTTRLLAERDVLLRQLLEVDGRARRHLAERLHDEALQYVLSARMDFDDARDRVPPDTQHRIDVALSRASAFLQATVSELRPITLEQYDLPHALRHIGQTDASECGLTVVIDGDGWPPGARTTVDALLFGIGRDLLSHLCSWGARGRVVISPKLIGEQAILQLQADKAAIATREMKRQLRSSGSSLATHHIHLQAAGGTIGCRYTPPNGTLITIRAPAAAETGPPPMCSRQGRMRSFKRVVSTGGRRHERHDHEDQRAVDGSGRDTPSGVSNHRRHR
jgi:two-component system NarL family sensor kinase